ncbi:MAG: type I restriction endonuclease [Sphaerochaetaceae bacterium]|nr:type I restriction endonuclease [Sphaerochaetaceae bacterium]
MMRTDMSEKGFETTITKHLVEVNDFEQGVTGDYNREYAIDTVRLFRFLNDTQPMAIGDLHILDTPLEKTKFLSALGSKLRSDGVVKILRSGMRYKHRHLEFYFPTPVDDNADAAEMYERNIFSVTRQLRYVSDSSAMSPDLVIFLNGLPIITLELKNDITKQKTHDAVLQYCRDRDPKEPHNAALFSFKKCMVHFAVDENTVMMCTKLEGQKSWFLPFNKGRDDGAGNPDVAVGYRTGYLWENILTKAELSNILQNYAQIVEDKDPDTGAKTYKQIFPRYHQLSVVTSLLYDAEHDGVGGKYLIQHSAGSGKSNSIAWLAHQLIALKKDGKFLYDTALVVTDRVNLDKQIRDTIRQFADVSSTVGWADDSSKLRKLLAEGKNIIITVVHKFEVIVGSIGTDYKHDNFAIIIDEAHSSQSGKLSAAMNIAVSGNDTDDEDLLEDKINALIESKKMAQNASYFAFTATPKNKTLENFGKILLDLNGNPVLNDNGEKQFVPHYVYTMKQAIEEGFIIDVLRNYTPVASYYSLASRVSDKDPQFNRKKAQAILRFYVESTKTAIEKKSEIIVEHFLSRVKNLLGGKARAMVVAQGIPRAVEYFNTITAILARERSEVKAIIAFSGEYERKTESGYNKFSSKDIEKNFKKEPYRILIVADKFQTGFDEPLLNAMYVDKSLADIKAVQTLSRLNRSYPGKKDTGVFVLDFVNDPGVIKKAFDRYYRTTMLSGETDPQKLNTLIDSMETLQVFTKEQVDTFVNLYLGGADRALLEPILKACKERYLTLDVEEQVLFKSNAKNFVRTYNFLVAILPYGSQEWEKLSIFLNLLKEILPAPHGDDYTTGLVESVDLENYRSVAQETMSIALANENAIIDPIPVPTDVGIQVPDLENLSKILEEFNKICGGLGINWTNDKAAQKQLLELPEVVKASVSYQDAMENSDVQNSRIESDKATRKAIQGNSTTGIEFYKAITDHPEFFRFVTDFVFNSTYRSNPGV